MLDENAPAAAWLISDRLTWFSQGVKQGPWRCFAERFSSKMILGSAFVVMMLVAVREAAKMQNYRRAQDKKTHYRCWNIGRNGRPDGQGSDSDNCKKQK